MEPATRDAQLWAFRLGALDRREQRSGGLGRQWLTRAGDGFSAVAVGGGAGAAAGGGAGRAVPFR
jgi:hypothetical protein